MDDTASDEAILGQGIPMRFDLGCNECGGRHEVVGLYKLLQCHTAPGGRFTCPHCGNVGITAREQDGERDSFVAAAMVDPAVEAPFPYVLIQLESGSDRLLAMQPFCVDTRRIVVAVVGLAGPPRLSSGHPRVLIRELRELGLLAQPSIDGTSPE